MVGVWVLDGLVGLVGWSCFGFVGLGGFIWWGLLFCLIGVLGLDLGFGVVMCWI